MDIDPVVLKNIGPVNNQGYCQKITVRKGIPRLENLYGGRRFKAIHKILLIGSGPIVIGQGCEFDYSGVQACKALKEEGFIVILINSNPATIMTDPEFSDRTYIEPLHAEAVTRIIAAERPDALLPTLGGQTGLNLTVQLGQRGALERYGVELIGAKLDAIQTAEDRQAFKEAMAEIGLATPASGTARDLEAARRLAREIGFPLVVRPSYVLGGRAMEVVHDERMLKRYVEAAVGVSPERPILIDKFLSDALEVEADAIADGTDASCCGPGGCGCGEGVVNFSEGYTALDGYQADADLGLGCCQLAAYTPIVNEESEPETVVTAPAISYDDVL